MSLYKGLCVFVYIYTCVSSLCMLLYVQVRVDTGIVEGSTISMFYDPMISKVRRGVCCIVLCVLPTGLSW